MSKPYRPPSVTVFPWLKSNLGNRALAPLTGTDTRALRAAVELIELYAYDSGVDVLEAFRLTVQRMQPHTRQLAYHAIAHIMNWEDRATIWTHCHLEPVVTTRCQFES
jgi:hypothetical protein